MSSNSCECQFFCVGGREASIGSQSHRQMNGALPASAFSKKIWIMRSLHVKLTSKPTKAVGLLFKRENFGFLPWKVSANHKKSLYVESRVMLGSVSTSMGFFCNYLGKKSVLYHSLFLQNGQFSEKFHIWENIFLGIALENANSFLVSFSYYLFARWWATSP